MRFLLALPLLLAVSCTQPRDQSARRTTNIDAAAEAGRTDIANYAAATNPDGNTPAILPTPIASTVPPPSPEPGTSDGSPTAGPTPAGTIAPDSAQGAAQVVQRYYALLAAGKYHDARLLWDNDGAASGMSDVAFAASFARYGAYHARVGAPGEIDAGAGQRYVSVPVRVDARLAGGGRYDAGGDVTLHRVGDIDGATAAQKAWHIHDIALKPAS